MLLKGGGEFAREKEVEATEMLSEICSLEGVPGGFMEAMLGCLEGNLVATFGKEGAALGIKGGVSILGVGVATTRNVRGAVFLSGESVDAVGLTGRDMGAIEPARESLPGVSIFKGVEVTEGTCVSTLWVTAAAMSNLPGCFRLFTSCWLTSSLFTSGALLEGASAFAFSWFAFA